MVRIGVAENLGAGRHALTELLGLFLYHLRKSGPVRANSVPAPGLDLADACEPMRGCHGHQ
jgi:hypothetical protein